jgi:hypothetical protein
VRIKTVRAAPAILQVVEGETADERRIKGKEVTRGIEENPMS